MGIHKSDDQTDIGVIILEFDTNQSMKTFVCNNFNTN